MSERVNEWAQRSARAKRAVQSKRMSEQWERTSEWRSEWPRTLSVDFLAILVILPTVRWICGSRVVASLCFTVLSLWLIFAFTSFGNQGSAQQRPRYFWGDHLSVVYGVYLTYLKYPKKFPSVAYINRKGPSECQKKSKNRIFLWKMDKTLFSVRVTERKSRLFAISAFTISSKMLSLC